MAKNKGNQNIDVDKAIRRIWKGYSKVWFDPLIPRNHNSGKNGTDLILHYKGCYYFIEIEGLDTIEHVNERNFHRSFFRILTRMKIADSKGYNNYKLIVAFPIGIGNGVGRRRNFGDKAWKKIAKAFPMLEFWCVDCQKNFIEMYQWKNYG